MRTITVASEARAGILDILSRRHETSGNIARKFMGAGALENTEESYSLVRDALSSLLADGLVEKHGNGKSVQWRLAETTRQRFFSEAAS